MDVKFTEEQEIMRRTARDFLETRCPKPLVRQMLQDEKGYTQELWQEMANLGWMGLNIPQEYGGAGGTFTDLMVLLEEMGRACMLGPFFSTVVLGGFCLLEAGNEQQKQMLLPKLANGQIIVTLAVTEPETDCEYNEPNSIKVVAMDEGNSFTVSGVKLFVSDAHVSNYIVCVARIKRMAQLNEGVTQFIIDTQSPGIDIAPLKTIGDKQYEVGFHAVKVPKERMLGAPNEGWTCVKNVLEKAAVAKCAEMIGGAQYVLDMTVPYAKERVQFGKPIGAFQAIQHHCANMLVDVECCRWLTYKTAWMIDEGVPYSKQASIAKAWCSEAYRRVVALGHQIFGGVGYILDHDMPLYFRHSRMAEVDFGTADFHRKLVADRIYNPD